MTPASSRINLNSKVNDLNKWIFCDVQISRYLVSKENKSILITKKNTKRIFHLFYLVNFIKLAFLFLKQISVQKNILLTGIDHIVLTTGAGHDEKNYLKHISKKENKFVTIEAFNTSAFMKVYKTNFQEIFKFFLEAIKEINKILSLELPGDLSELILANVKKNLANYSYLCAVVSKIHSDYPNLIVYHSGSSFFSAVTRRIGVRTRYLLHGLMGQVGKLSYPIYDQIHVYCKEEAEYLRKMSPKSEVKLYSFKDMKDFKKKIVIFMRIEDYLMKKEDLGEVISVFKKNSYEIILKRHPTYNGSLVKDLLTSHNVRLLENNTLDATEIILEEKPSFTVGWLSTSLCESLQSGVIPITLKDNKNPMDSTMESPLIYPIEKRSFSWKNERETINRLLIRMEEYPNFLETLKTR